MSFSPGGIGSRGIVAGAAGAPARLQPSERRPIDFDASWESKIKWLKAIPEDPVVTSKESGNPNVEYAIIPMDHINGTQVHGQFAKPKQGGQFPGLMVFQWAGGPYPLQRQWVTDHEAEGWLALDIEPHDVLPDQPQSYDNALPQELENHHAIGRNDRDKGCFLQMYLVDTIAPPAGIWTAFNQIQGPKEALPLVDAPHNISATAANHDPAGCVPRSGWAPWSRAGKSKSTRCPRTSEPQLRKAPSLFHSSPPALRSPRTLPLCASTHP